MSDSHLTTQRKRILLLDTGKEWGGGTNSMLELLKRIDRASFDIRCCFYHNYRRGKGDTIAEVLSSLAIPVVFIAQCSQPRWAKVTKELLRSLVFFNRSLRLKTTRWVDIRWRIQPNAQRIRQAIAQYDIDLLYMNNQPGSNIEGYMAATGLAITVVQHCRIEPVLDRQLVERVNRRGDAIITVSNGVRDVLLANGVEPQKCFTVFNAIDTQQPLPDRQTMRHQLLNVGNGTFVFGSIGALIPRKSHHHILQALAKFAAEFPQADWRMVIVGEGPEEQALKRQAAEAGIQERVVFTGFQPDALNYLAALDVFVLASKSEGLPRVVLEAMLLGTAVIGSKVTGTAELISANQTGLIFNYGDTDALFEQMKTLYLDEDKRARLVEQAHANVKAHYAIEHYVAGVEAVLKNTTHGRRPHV